MREHTRRPRWPALLSTALLACVLAGCGGSGSGGAPGQRVSLEGRVDVAVVSRVAPARLTVCLDTDGDLHCGAGEPGAAVDADGRYTLQIERRPGDGPGGAALVVEVPAVLAAGDATPAYVLAAPAETGVTINVLTTLETMRARLSARGLQQARALPAAADGGPLAEAARTNALLSPVFVGSLPLLVPPEGAILSGAQVTMEAAATLMAVLQPYVDAATGAPLHALTSRTLFTEVAHRLRPQRCTPQPVASARIDTHDAAPVVSKSDYLDAVLTLDDAVAPPTVLATRIRGRGNSTWTMPKKPYRLKLDQPAALLGMPADRDWVLLANYSDKTMLRNSVAFCLSRMLGLDYTPRDRYVELTLNGDAVGLYQLVEQIKVAEARVDIGPAAAQGGDPGLAFLLEIDRRLDEEHWHVSTHDVPYTVKSDLADGQMPAIVQFIEAMESALFSEAFTDPMQGYRRYIDVDTLVDFHLLNELMRNNDAFFSSTYVHRPRDGRLRFGPVWDFDIAAGNIDFSGNDDPVGWWVRDASPYLQRLMQDGQYRQYLRARWAYLSSRLGEVHAFIDDAAAVLQPAQVRNFERWPILETWVWPNAVVTGSYAGEVGHLQQWLQVRGAWMDDQLREGGPAIEN